MSLKLKDEDSTKRMKDMQEELKDPSLGEFSDLEQDPYVIETTRTTPIERPEYYTDRKSAYEPTGNPYILSEEKQARIFGEDLGDKEIRKKSVRKEVMIVMFVGLALLFAGLAAYVHNDLFLRKAETVPGIVTEKRMHRNHATCTIFVDYEVDGKTYNEIYVGDGHDMQIGQKVTVYYDPEKPTKITDGRKIPTMSVYLVIIGGALFLIGGYLVFWMNQNPDKGFEIYNRIFKKNAK